VKDDDDKRTFNLVLSEVDNLGQFMIRFSEPVKIPDYKFELPGLDTFDINVFD
jgi:hypothetical protein